MAAHGGLRGIRVMEMGGELIDREHTAIRRLVRELDLEQMRRLMS